MTRLRSPSFAGQAVLDRVKRFFGAAPASDPAPEAKVPMREAAGVTIDDDDDQWRRLTGDAQRDLPPMTQKRMRDLAVYLWETNLLANRLIELPLAYILAEGVHLEAKDPEAQTWLDAFWKDPINKMSIKLTKKVRELSLFGEQCWPVFVNEINGHCRLGYLDPELIETVVVDPDNAEQPIGIVTRPDNEGRRRRYRVIINGPEEIFTKRTRQIRATFDTGICFYFAINNLSNSRRGRSDLLAQIDWLDAYDHFLFGELERGGMLRSFIWDVTLTGATPEEVKKRAGEISAPKPGAVRIHNDAEAWKAETPELQAVDSAEGARLFRNHVLGGGTIPEHWYGGGGDVNRATAGEMGDPTYKIFTMRQTTIKDILEEVGTFVIWRRLDPTGEQSFDPEALTDDIRPKAVFPELTAKDLSKYATALPQIVSACAVAVDRRLMSEKTALRLIAIIADQLGVEIDAEAELAAAKAEAAARAEQDVFQQPVPDAPGGGNQDQSQAPGA